MRQYLVTLVALSVFTAMFNMTANLAEAQGQKSESGEPAFTSANIDVAPDTLNLKSKGKWITCYIEVPGFSPEEVASAEVVSIEVEDEVYNIPIPGKIKNPEPETAVVQFDRQNVIAYIKGIELESPVDVLITVTGELSDGTPFKGEDIMRIIHSGEEEPLSQVTVVESSATHLTLEFSPGHMYFTAVEMADGRTYSAIVDPSSGLFDVGKPAVPVFGNWILIPNGTEVDLQIDPGEPLIFQDIDVPPVQSFPPDYEGVLPPPFARDEEIYGTDADSPGFFASLEPTKIMRGQECTISWLYPYQHNPVKRTLSVYPDLSVTVRFHGEPSPIPSRLKSESFDSMMHRTALNADAVLSELSDDPPIPSGSYGWDYIIIITDSEFDSAAKKLKQWRDKTGFKTLVCKFPKKWQASDIRKDIQQAYDSWDIVPEYILLIGDAEYIPCFYKTWHPSNLKDSFKCDCGGCVKLAPYRENYVGTDLYYTMMDGPSDDTPDIAIGRLSVDEGVQAIKRIEDIIKYEKDPVTDSSFYKHAAICTEFEDMNIDLGNGWPPTPTCNPDTYEDHRRAQSAEDLALFLEDPQYKIQKKIDRIYCALSQINPKHWSKNPSNFAGQCTQVGGVIPKSLLRSSGFKWNGTGIDILNALNPHPGISHNWTGKYTGRFLLAYRGHGGMDRWRAPSLDIKDLTSYNLLWNGDRLPVVLSLACNTGWFDNETDFKLMPSWLKGEPLVDYTASNAVCFSEQWERCENAGAIGIIAGTRITFAYLNDRLFEGMIKAIWPNYKPDKLATIIPPPILRMGDVLNYARSYMLKKANLASDPQEAEKKKANCEAYHWFGDPAMEIRTVKPLNMIAKFPPQWRWATYPRDLVFNVKIITGDRYPGPPRKATVTISKADAPSDYWVGKSDEEGNVTFPSLITSTLGEYDVVVTASNCIPFQGTFESQAGRSGGIILDAELYSCSSEIEIRVADADLMGTETLDVLVYATAGDLDGDVDGDPAGGDEEIVTLTETPAGRGMFVGTICTGYANDDGQGDVVPGNYDDILQVSDGGAIWARYLDESDAMDDATWMQDTAVVDCEPPVFGGLSSATGDNDFIMLQWDKASDRHGPVTYNIYRGQTPGPPIGSLVGSTWALSYPDYNCEFGQTYYYVVRAQDAVGNEDSNTVEREASKTIEE